VDTRTYHLNLFFDEDWALRSGIISYGHDIEASWLLLEAAEVLEDKALIRRAKDLSLKMAIAATGGLNPDGSMNYEFFRADNHMITERHWWVQAEAIVGFLNAWQLTGEAHFTASSGLPGTIRKNISSTARRANGSGAVPPMAALCQVRIRWASGNAPTIIAGRV